MSGHYLLRSIHTQHVYCLIFQQIHAFFILKKWGTKHVQGHEVRRKYDTLFDILKVVKVVPNMAKYIFTAY
jgi:hypothetical protein